MTFTYGVDAAPGAKTVYSTSFDAAADAPMNGYSIGADGALAALAGSPFPTAIFGSEYQSVTTSPNQGPTALFTADSPGAGQPAQFNASSSNDPDGGTVATYLWDFGDGSPQETTTTPSTSHTYANAGNYTVSLTVTDDEGCSNVILYTGQTADCNPSIGGARSTQGLQVGEGPDNNVPDLKLKGKKQKLGKVVKVKAGTNDQTDAVATGKLKTEGPKKGKVALGSYSLKKDKETLTGDGKQTLKLKVPSKAQKKGKKALKKGGKVTAKITVKVTDADDDKDKASVKVKLTKK